MPAASKITDYSPGGATGQAPVEDITADALTRYSFSKNDFEKVIEGMRKDLLTYVKRKGARANQKYVAKVNSYMKILVDHYRNSEMALRWLFKDNLKSKQLVLALDAPDPVKGFIIPDFGPTLGEMIKYLEVKVGAEHITHLKKAINQ